MMYKNIVFMALLMSLPLTKCEDSNELRIKELEEIQFQKMLELSNLGKMIAERDEFLRHALENRQHIFDLVKQDKITQLEKSKGIKLSSEEMDKIDQEIKDSMKLFLEKFYESNINETKELIIEELYDQNNLDSITSFESLRFMLLRFMFECDFLLVLVAKYASCSQELLKINIEFNSLKNANIV